MSLTNQHNQSKIALLIRDNKRSSTKILLFTVWIQNKEGLTCIDIAIEIDSNNYKSAIYSVLFFIQAFGYFKGGTIS
ncbi:MAG: hypothetical protein E6L04_06325 [Thaumarchaeota archaeon]|nr:MAG: hypothetical protein E6L04_06325 [Nitrososphaerota archaeon]